MNDNPYQAPAEFSRAQESLRPFDKCPHCKRVITFFDAMKQGTPFQFRCSGCRQITTIQAPYSKTIFAMVIVLSAITVIGMFFALELFGMRSLLLVVPIAVAGFFVLEWCTHVYLQKYGKFVTRDLVNRNDENEAIQDD